MAFCHVCRAFVPAVRQYAGKALGGILAAVFGIGATTLPGKILGVLASLAGGHLVDEAAGPVCGRCGSPLRSEA